MALRIGMPTGLRPSTSSSCDAALPRPIRASLQQRKKETPKLSPLRKAEEIASTFGFEMAVVDLERLFSKEASEDHPLLRRKLAGPSAPFPAERSAGKPLRVAYQGIPGSYCQEAAAKAFSSIRCEAFPCSHMEDAFQALKEGEANQAIVPVENSIDGTIDRNFDLLLRHQDVEIIGELVLPVNHCLLSLKGTSRSDLRRVISHPQALSHCWAKLEGFERHLEIEEVHNAAEAARYISENRITDTAVIGSRIAAKEFGLEVLEQNFQDRSENFNRFWQLGLGAQHQPRELGDAWKTTVAFSLEKGASDLFRAMWIFESRDISVTKVDHRPNRSNPIRVKEESTGDHKYFDYVFVMDVEGSASDSSMEKALKVLKEISGFVHVLGSYTCRLKN
ncbi:hypothetical protein QJS10_CPB04g01186 [Acorus calamus]|uniref:Prephenate dehydratase domain-containing protein n=1 Tax=Acorus calamus TaxID=4465 RepID=A0AAV9F292_ACOCL|nr:hypothetical protein QJS10_CPB04g01186 [Acorus calamus]